MPSQCSILILRFDNSNRLEYINVYSTKRAWVLLAFVCLAESVHSAICGISSLKTAIKHFIMVSCHSRNRITRMRTFHSTPVIAERWGSTRRDRLWNVFSEGFFLSLLWWRMKINSITIPVTIMTEFLGYIERGQCYFHASSENGHKVWLLYCHEHWLSLLDKICILYIVMEIIIG